MPKLVLKLILVLLFSGHAVWGQSQEVKMVDFEGLKPWLEKQTDSVYVVNFWATWCAPCVKEIPAFEELHKQYAGDRVKVLMVNLDFPRHLESRVLPFISRMGMQTHVIMLNDPDANRWIGQVSEAWSGAIPATVVYSRDFNGFYEREFTFEQLEEIVLPLLK